MKQEIVNFGKSVALKAGKYMPQALTGMSIIFTGGACGLGIKAGMDLQKARDEEKELTWQDYLAIFAPAAGSLALAWFCEYEACSKSERKYAAAVALANAYETASKERESKARELFGDKEVDKMNEEIVKDKIRRAPEPMVAYGGTAFLDLMTGQYIYEDVETIRAKINSLNNHMNNGHGITKAEWCDTFDLYSSTGDEEIGWSNSLTGNIEVDFVFETLQSGRTVAAICMETQPRLFYDEEKDEDIDEYYRQRNPGWSEV